MSSVSKEISALQHQHSRDAYDNALKNANPTQKFLNRDSASDPAQWEWSKETVIASEEVDAEFNSSPDNLTALTQLRNFIVNKGTIVSDGDVEQCNFVKNTTTVKAEHQCLSVEMASSGSILIPL